MPCCSPSVDRGVACRHDLKRFCSAGNARRWAIQTLIFFYPSWYNFVGATRLAPEKLVPTTRPVAPPFVLWRFVERGMPSFIDLSGKKFGRLTVIGMFSKNGRGFTKCLCDCGAETSVRSDQLKSGDIRSCGCLKAEYWRARLSLDLTGQRFNRLIVLRMAGTNKHRQTRCEVLCDCGNIKVVRSGGLVNGTTNSCGCYHKDRVGEVTRLDITGIRYGKLFVLRMAGVNKRKKSICEVLCDCGRHKFISSDSLVKGNAVSCGCAVHEPHKGRTPYMSFGARIKSITSTQNRRAIKKKAVGSYTDSQIKSLYSSQKGRCANCVGKLGESFHRDHIIPLSKGGENGIKNIQLLCQLCNLRKGAKDPIDFACEAGRLL